MKFEKERLDMLILFISDFVHVDPHCITQTTALEKDLSLCGDEAYDFMKEYSEKFNVDIQNLDIDIYFSCEESTLLRHVMKLFGLNKKSKELFVMDLYYGILNGRLEDD